MIVYKEFDKELLGRVKEIYQEGGWRAYLSDDEKLARAFQNSLYIWGAFEDDELIGFVRCVGDEVDNRFYQSFGMRKLVEGDMVSYFR